MGRITVFTENDCRRCYDVKFRLKQMQLPFVEVNITGSQRRQNDLLSLCGGTLITCPQVFFNSRRVGGAEETLRVLHNWSTAWRRHGCSLEAIYGFEIYRQPDPTNPCFFSSAGGNHGYHGYGGSESKRLDVVLRLPREPALFLPDGSSTTSVREITETLKAILPLNGNKYRLTIYKNSFLGRQAVQCLQKFYNIESKEKAVAYGRYLQERNILDHVVGEHEFGDTGYFFRLTCHQRPDVLNTYRQWKDGKSWVEDPVELLRYLGDLIGRIEKCLMDNSIKGRTDYRSAPSNPLFPHLEEAFCELQRVNLARMDDCTKTAFGVNLYNLMIKFALMKVGSCSAQKSTLNRMAFFGGLKFNVGGHVFSFDDWEHGILRGNRKAPSAVSCPFGSNDPRCSLAVHVPDPRIHFALNCGTNSCPPVRYLTPEHLDEELTILALSYCDDDSNVYVGPEEQEIYLSKLFSWYKGDFVQGRNGKLVGSILKYCTGTKERSLQQLWNAGEPVHVRYYDFDWNTSDDVETARFESKALRANVKSLVVGAAAAAASSRSADGGGTARTLGQ